MYLYLKRVIKWLFLTWSDQFSVISWREQATFRWDDADGVQFVLDQHIYK